MPTETIVRDELSFEEAVEAYIVRLNAAVEKRFVSKITPDRFVVTKGRKFLRVVRLFHGDADQRSAHAFIVRPGADCRFEAGAILKADGWKGPALNFSRGSVFNLPVVREGMSDPLEHVGN